MTTRRSDRALSLLVLLILLALALRLYRLADSPVRGDEAFTIQYWPASWSDALDLVGIDPHPWLAYALFAHWQTIFGDGEWVMRLLPTLLSLPGVAATYALARRLRVEQRAALLATLLVAVHPFLIWHAQDVRDYAIWASFSAIASWAFLLAITAGGWRNWLLYAITTLLSAYIFFLHPFVIAAQGLYVIVAKRRRLRAWLLSIVGVAVAMIPWSIMLATAAGSRYGGTADRFDLSLLITWFLPTLTIGSTLPQTALDVIGIGLLVGGIIALVALWRWRRDATLFLGIQVAVPTLCLSVVALRMNVFRPRYLVAVVPYVVLFVAAVVVYLTTRKYRWVRFGALGLLAVVLAADGWALINHYLDPAYRKAPNWRDLGAYLTAHTQPGDLVVQQALDPGFTYYFRGPADETTLPLSPNAPAEETIAILEQAITDRRAVWLIPGAPAGYDDARVPLTWLTSEAQLTLAIDVAGFRVLEFRRWEVRPAEYTPRTREAFDDAAALLDWHLDRPTAATLRLIAYWRPLTPTEEPLSGFLHLVGPPRPDNGLPLWAQDDHRVPGGLVDTTTWDPDTVYRDVYLLTLPHNVPGGTWSLHIGLYHPTTMERLIIGDADHLEIALEDFPGQPSNSPKTGQ